LTTLGTTSEDPSAYGAVTRSVPVGSACMAAKAAKTHTLSNKMFGFLAAAAAFTELLGCESSSEERNIAEDNAALVVSAYEKVLNQHDTKALEAMFAEDYIQHNPQVADGRDGLAKLVEHLSSQPEVHSGIKRVIAQGDLVALHVHLNETAAQRGNDCMGLAIVDLFRVDQGKIVEHWHVVQAVPPTSVSGHSMVDGGGLYQGAAQ
jgi:predicted SnoaL-like aldol condensation-catalyzing enzyme